MKPVILITPRMIDEETYALSHNYTNAIKSAGGIPIIPSYGKVSEIDEILEFANGILLSGGGDIDASFFGEETDDRANFIYKFRDEYEIELCKKAIEKNTPILGICRGIQVLNVALGGTLTQHIDGHYVKGVDGTDLLHNIDIVKNSYFEKIYGTNNMGINSVHHQCIDKLGKGLIPQCYSTCGIVEGVKLEGEGYVVGVQFHPEIIVSLHGEHKALFNDFINACSHMDK